ncbi:diacylglycerol kinase family protein [Tuwongella immobilis]|nr:diacylglycerol kinase family protein [Tuwongella immobilis]
MTEQPLPPPDWEPPQDDQSDAMPTPRRRCRTWRDKFGEAFRGVKLGIRGHSSFFVHFFVAALVIVAGIVFACDRWEWGLLIGCIGMVLTAELFNSSLETLFHAQDDAVKNRVQGVLDIAAGAVLMAAMTSSVIGLIVFVPKILDTVRAILG